MLKTSIVTLLLSLPDYYGTAETAQQRYDRMALTAEAIDSSSSYATCSGPWKGADWCSSVWPREERIELIAMQITLGWWESRFAKHVHEGKCRVSIGECDAVRLPDGRFVALARSPWQIQWSPLVREQWHHMTGATPIATFEASYAAARVLGSARNRCARQSLNWTIPTISGYASGRACHWSKAQARAKTYEKVLARIQHGQTEHSSGHSGDFWKDQTSPNKS